MNILLRRKSYRSGACTGVKRERVEKRKLILTRVEKGGKRVPERRRVMKDRRKWFKK